MALTSEENEICAQEIRELIPDTKMNYKVYKSLDSIAMKGKVILTMEANPCFGGSISYESEILTSPTWRIVAIKADEMLKSIKTEGHCFLEGIERVAEEKGVQIVSFKMSPG